MLGAHVRRDSGGAAASRFLQHRIAVRLNAPKAIDGMD
jgi:hypothetical protein